MAGVAFERVNKRLSRIVRSWVRLSGLLIGAVMLIGSAAGAAGESLKEELKTRYETMKTAMAAHDGSATNDLFAPDFMSFDTSGRSETASQMIAEVNGLKPDPNKVSATTLISLNPVGNTVTVEQRYDMKTIRVGADGVAHWIKLITLSWDTWVKSGNTWLLRRTVTGDVCLFRDGRLVVHKVKP